MRWALIGAVHLANLALLGYQTWRLGQDGDMLNHILVVEWAMGTGAALCAVYTNYKLHRHMTRISHLAAAKRRATITHIRPRETPGAENL